MAQAPRFGAGAGLQLLVAEAGLGPLLGGDHIRLIHSETGAPGQGQEGCQVRGVGGVVEAAIEGSIGPGVGQKGIQLVEAHGTGVRAIPL